MTRIVQLSKVFALLALVVVTGACSKANPLTPKTCMEPSAPNFGQEGDCLPAPAPAKSTVSLAPEDSLPKVGETLTALTIDAEGYAVGDWLQIYVNFALSEADKADAATRGLEHVVRACLSTDGVNPVNSPGACAITRIPTDKMNGQVGHKLSVVRTAVTSHDWSKPEAPFVTRHVLLTLELMPPAVLRSDGTRIERTPYDGLWKWK